MKIRCVYHPNPPDFPPGDQDRYATVALERAKVGIFWVDYYPPGVPTQADVDAFIAPPVKQPRPKLLDTVNQRDLLARLRELGLDV